MVFDQSKAPCELGQMRKWFSAHMESDALSDQPPALFLSFLKTVQKKFPALSDCPDDRLDYACEYEIHRNFVYMCFGYSIAKEAHDIVKRQAKINGLGFWDVSQSFDRTFPITLPTDKWPLLLESAWVKYNGYYVYGYKEIRRVLRQMKTAERSSICLSDRQGNYIQAGGYQDAFIVEHCRYTDAVTCRHMRADLKEENSDADTPLSINDFTIRVPKSQILSLERTCSLFQAFTEDTLADHQDIFWKILNL